MELAKTQSRRAQNCIAICQATFRKPVLLHVLPSPSTDSGCGDRFKGLQPGTEYTVYARGMPAVLRGGHAPGRVRTPEARWSAAEAPAGLRADAAVEAEVATRSSTAQAGADLGSWMPGLRVVTGPPGPTQLVWNPVSGADSGVVSFRVLVETAGQAPAGAIVPPGAAAALDVRFTPLGLVPPIPATRTQRD